MGNSLGLWSDSSPEEHVIQNHHNDLQQVIINPLNVASKLLQEGVVSRTLISEVNTLGRSQSQNSTALITAVTASIHSKPDQFQVFMSVLEDSPESANLATRMRNELSILKPAPGPIERLREKKGWRYTVSAEYKRDFILLQDEFGTLFRSISKAVKSQVPVDDLKEYLCETFPEFKIPLQDASTTDDVMKAVRNQSSLTDLAYFDRINDHFNLQVTQEIDKYRAEILESFCQHTLYNHTYVQSFREDYPRYILSSDKIVFQLQWKANEKTLKDIRDVLRMSFRHLADRVQILVIEDGSVVVVCWAPRYLMEELVRHASESVHRLAEMGVVKLTIGGTEVNIEKQPTSSSHWLRGIRSMSQSSESRITSSRVKISSGYPKQVYVPIKVAIQEPEIQEPEIQKPEIQEPEAEGQKFKAEIQKLEARTEELFDAGMQRLQLQEPATDIDNTYLTQRAVQADVTSGYYSRVSGMTATQSDVTSEYSRQSEFSPYTRRKPKTITYLTKLSSPRGMVISQEGHLIVAERYNHCITIINTDSGEVINRFGQKGSGQVEFQYPEGVSLTQDGYLVVADTGNNRLQLLTVEGAFVAAVGSWGSQPLQFYHPYDVAVHQNGKFFVTEQLNHRVQVLNPDLSYSHCFASKGDKPGELDNPHGIAIDQDGMVYISDYYNKRIQKFTSEGHALVVFEYKGMLRAMFSPYGLCIDSNNLLYVTDRINDFVCVFSTSGPFLGHIGNGGFNYGPRFTVSDNKDRLYVCDDNGVTTYKCYQQ